MNGRGKMRWAGLLLVAGLAARGAGNEVTVGSRGELRVNGEPFFPIFAWAQPRSLIAFNRELGINAITPGERPDGEGSRRALFDELHANGMFAMPDAGDLSPGLIGHPALLCWRFGDEPDITRAGPDGRHVARVTPETLIERYREVRARDPGRPVWINLTARFFETYRGETTLSLDAYRRYGQACDVISYDHYPVTGWNRPDRIAELYHATRALIDLYPGKAHWVIVENADQNLSWTPRGTRGPTPQETRAMVWMSLVAGAKGIGYFPVAFNPFRWQNLTPEMRAEMPRLNAEIQSVAPVLLVGDVLPSRVSDERVAVRAMRHEGVEHLFAVNLARERVSASVTVEGWVRGTLHDRDGGAPAGVEGGRLTLTLEPLARRMLRSRPW